MFGRARRALRIAITLAILAAACVAGVVIWNHYVTGPWTRDGQVLANVVNIAPEVAGRVTKLYVVDNQTVHKGDPLYEIDPLDYQVAVATAQANVNSKLADMKLKQIEAKRRAILTTLSTSDEERQTYGANADVAAAAYATAIAQLSQAHINLDRTHVVSPVNGYITNLLLREGDYATTGTRNISILDSDSFWIAGYFEETKLSGIRLGDPAIASLMGYRDPVQGHVESLARGINTPNTDPGNLGLASVSPVFTWVRLAQRIPVRIHIDQVPDAVHLAAGMTATVSVGPGVQPNSLHGALSRAASP
ncbi:HlyD family secretion protein [Acidisphaera sp. L21]|uniref:efflux RND transporter periplasmic adaptor subunit n=1 Tax=Acidisphaera sp. L21 TaxID=1641851 RepID=UPI00131E8572|nr:HlyD family secretion protein [Acidisphaera sp. L21]